MIKTKTYRLVSLLAKVMRMQSLMLTLILCVEDHFLPERVG